MNTKNIQWILRVAVFGEFLGHGIFALQSKPQWLGWISQLTGVNNILAAKILLGIGILDILVAVIVLFKPLKPFLLWATFWGFWTALVRPLVGEPIWDFVERWTNWGAPLTLFLLLKNGKYHSNKS